MSRLRGRNGAPLTETERRLVLLIKLYQKKNRHGPTWSWLRHQAGLSHQEINWTMRVLRNRRAIGYKDGVQHSTYATAIGVQAALHPEREQATSSPA